MIINQFRLVLPLRWSPQWYCFFRTLIALNVINWRKFVRMLHVINEVTIDRCNTHQIKENAEVKSNRWLSIHAICGSTLVHKINSTHAAIVKLGNLRTRNPFLSSEPIICHSFLQGQMQMTKVALTDYPSTCKPLY